VEPRNVKRIFFEILIEERELQEARFSSDVFYDQTTNDVPLSSVTHKIVIVEKLCEISGSDAINN